mmetsp:Transcript_24967/g.40676  ORF Transcript_24967/g.40676 Transcript_24967/m.40676 type:complete len:229 (+) Transcript_24967:212-898(+)
MPKVLIDHAKIVDVAMGAIALPTVSTVTAKPLIMARSAGPAALFVKVTFTANCEKMLEAASICARLAVHSEVQKGSKVENMIPSTLTMMEVQRPPSFLVNLGNTNVKYKILQMPERASRKPTCFSDMFNPPTACSEISHRGNTSKMANRAKPWLNRMQMINGTGHLHNNCVMDRFVAVADPSDPSGKFFTDLEVFLSRKCSKQKRQKARDARHEPIILGASAGNSGIS